MQRRIIGAVTATFLVAVTAPVVIATPASATAYRYWSYWHAPSTTWEFSRVGPSGYRPADGVVEGWRFAVSPGSASAPSPRQAPGSAFETICGGTPAVDGKKRVALVVDFGVAADAPSGDTPPGDALRGSCVVLPPTANGWDALTAGGYSIRSDSGLICGLAGYPERGCGEVVEVKPTAAPSTPATGRSPQGSDSGGGAGRAPKSGPRAADTGNSGGTGSRTASTAKAGAASASASPTAHKSSSPSPTASGSAIPTAQPQDTSDAPTLVEGAPASSGDGVGGPLPLIAGLLVLAALGTAAYLRTRRKA